MSDIEIWLSRLDEEITGAAHEGKLPPDVIRGFDGDIWSWVWREYLERQTRAAEVQFRVVPDSLEEGFQVELSASAWMLTREWSWTRVYSAHYFRTIDEAFDLWRELRSLLPRGWYDAYLAAARLGNIEKARDETAKKLRDRRILE